jgi:hypothetical protein
VATLLTAWLACAAVAFVVVWFTPLNVWFTPLILEHGQQVACAWGFGEYKPGSCPVSTINPNATPYSGGGYMCPDGTSRSCYDARTRAAPPTWVMPALRQQLGEQGPEYREVSVPAKRADLPILALRAAALGTVFWVAFLGVRAVLARVRFTVG